MAKKILVVEDEIAYARALVFKLEHEGYVVVGARNGEEALQILEAGGIDLMLCDLIMPKMNGFALLEEMRTRNVSVPTVVLSNLSQMEDEKKATALGAVGYLSKSNTSMAVVIAKVNSILS